MHISKAAEAVGQIVLPAMKPALLLGLSASAAALNVNRRDALKGTTASVAQIALPTASLAQVAMPAPAVAAAAEKLALPKMGIGAWYAAASYI